MIENWIRLGFKLDDKTKLVWDHRLGFLDYRYHIYSVIIKKDLIDLYD